MRLIVGLGNPGPDYMDTRHNIGFRVVAELARIHSIKVAGRLGPALYGEGKINGGLVMLLQPQTFMNRSGPAVRRAALTKELAYDQMIIVYDDLDLPLGKLRLRVSGSAGGHKGMASIIETLGSQDIPRLRVGIGRPEKQDVVSYVLDRFAAHELDAVEDAVQEACEQLARWVITEGDTPHGH